MTHDEIAKSNPACVLRRIILVEFGVSLLAAGVVIASLILGLRTYPPNESLSGRAALFFFAGGPMLALLGGFCGWLVTGWLLSVKTRRARQELLEIVLALDGNLRFDDIPVDEVWETDCYSEDREWAEEETRALAIAPLNRKLVLAGT